MLPAGSRRVSVKLGAIPSADLPVALFGRERFLLGRNQSCWDGTSQGKLGLLPSPLWERLGVGVAVRNDDLSAADELQVKLSARKREATTCRSRHRPLCIPNKITTTPTLTPPHKGAEDDDAEIFLQSNQGMLKCVMRLWCDLCGFARSRTRLNDLGSGNTGIPLVALKKARVMLTL